MGSDVLRSGFGNMRLSHTIAGRGTAYVQN